MKRSEFIGKYEGKEWQAADGTIRIYLNLEKAMPGRLISRKIRNTVKIWLGEDNVLHVYAPGEGYYTKEVIADAETIEED